MMRFPRESYIPKGDKLTIKGKTSGCVVYLFERAGKPYGMGFYRKSEKPVFHYSFRSVEQRMKYVTEWVGNIEGHQARKLAEREKRKAFTHDVKVGDIFRSSWGYDQTNIDYYQCTKLIGSHMMEVREICQEAEETGFMQGKCVPVPGSWATEPDYSEAGKAYHAEHGHYPRKDKAPMRVKIQGHQPGDAYFRVASYAIASRVKPAAMLGNKPVYEASHWTSYA
jgi:hypothetical protein